MTNQPNELLPWPDNMVADRHDVSGKWVLHYLTDEQAELCSAALTRATSTPEQCEWVIPTKFMSELALHDFHNMIQTIKHGGQVDVVARVDGVDYRWECDGLKYAYLKQPTFTTEQKSE